MPGDLSFEILRMERLVTRMPAKTYSFTLFVYEGIYLILEVLQLNLYQLLFLRDNLAHHLFRIVMGVLLTYNEQDYDYL